LEIVASVPDRYPGRVRDATRDPVACVALHQEGEDGPLGEREDGAGRKPEDEDRRRRAYSNAHRGIALRREVFIEVPPENEPSDPPRPDRAWLAARRKSWACLIRRVYEVDPFLCRCGERTRVVVFITHPPIIRKVLDHIGRRFDPVKLPGQSPPLLDDIHQEEPGESVTSGPENALRERGDHEKGYRYFLGGEKQ
jgi:hypothetical protein